MTDTESKRMDLGEEKNKMIQSLQDIFHEHMRVQEEMMNIQCNCIQDKKESLDTIQNQEQTITNHLESIQSLEKESKDQKKQLSEYESMIRDLEDKLSATLKDQGEEKETSNKFNMIRTQANEITNKDREIERLNKLVLSLKTKEKEKKLVIEKAFDECNDASGGWSPTMNQTPAQPNLESEDGSEDEKAEEEPSAVIESVLASVGEAIQKLEPVVTVEEVSVEDEEKDVEEVEEDVEDVEETETLVYRKKEYLILTAEEDQVVYRKDGDKRGPRVGVWGVTKSGKRKVILDK